MPHIRPLVAVTLLCTLIAAPAADGQAPAFQGLGTLPTDVGDNAAYALSGDGQFVAGYHSAPDGQTAFRWSSAAGFHSLGFIIEGDIDSIATGASLDGSFICGDGAKLRGHDPFRWDPVNGMVSLGNLRGTSRFFSNGAAHAISDNGRVVVGFSDNIDLVPEAFRWVDSGLGDGSGTMTGLGDLLGGPFSSIAYGVSGDGQVVVGQSDSGAGSVPFRWTQAEGMQPLGTFGFIIDIGESGLAADASGDGSVIVGWSLAVSEINPEGFQSQAFRWTATSGLINLGDLPGGRFYSLANAVSADGSVVVGQATSANAPDTGGLEAFYWSAATGMRSIRDLLASRGVDMTGWTLTSATDVSNNGQRLAGFGLHNGTGEAWVATIPTLCPGDFNASGAVTVQDIFDFLAAYFASDRNADRNVSGDISAQDIFDFLAAYFAQCS